MCIRRCHSRSLLWNIDHCVANSLVLSVSQLGHELVKMARKIIMKTYTRVKEPVSSIVCA